MKYHANLFNSTVKLEDKVRDSLFSMNINNVPLNKISVRK